jgi:hypothetical protein
MAEIYPKLKQPELITDENRQLVGKETYADYSIIYRNGKYVDSNGNEISQVVDTDIPDSRIVKKILHDTYVPSSIVEFETLEKNGSFISPEIITINGSLSILTKKNGEGWNLKVGDKVSFSFEKYISEVVSNQNLVIGYIKDGVLVYGKGFSQSAGTYELTISEAGEYYIYLINASSDSISMKEGNLKISEQL